MLLTNCYLGIVLGFIFTVAAIPIVRVVATRFGVVARPREDRWHRGSIPLLGGLAITVGFVAASAITGSLDLPLASAAIMMCAVGLVDDVITLAPRTKLVLQIMIVALLMSWSPWRLPQLPATLSFIVVMFWIVGLVNAVNMLDHLDGVCAGTTALGALGASVLLYLHGNPSAAVAAAVAGACAGFLVFNFNPASIFMGDGGALTLGLMLATLAMRAGGSDNTSLPMGSSLALLLAFTPILDTTTVTASRLMLGSRISVGGRDHSSHRLVALGLSDRQAAMLLFALSASTAAIAVALSRLPAQYFNEVLPITAVIFLVLAFFLIDQSFRNVSPGDVFVNSHGLGRLLLTISYKRRIAEVVLDGISIVAAYGMAVLFARDFELAAGSPLGIVRSAPSVAVVTLCTLGAFGVYRSMWHYTGLEDTLRVFCATAIASLVLLVGRSMIAVDMHASTALLFWLMASYVLIGTRLSFRVLSGMLSNLARSERRIVGISSGAHDLPLIDYFCRSYRNSARIVGFVDVNEFLQRRRIHGVPVLGTLSEIETILSHQGFEEMVVLGSALNADERLQVVNFAKAHGLVVRSLRLMSEEMTAQPDGIAIAYQANGVRESPVAD
ncbi:MAG: hypothetical protein Q7S58_10330 [Candidatus Binatus sp.]|uniref:hypothetical protein n=1 Tax=Candidatus Binatus sp. TaxID=2811406 RepID=UPI00271E1360|nr:hypothetical protein [Candidatus Binatus sp.]MDO8432789.1 hypothetical protein [Candidatus Binatus sp.]